MSYIKNNSFGKVILKTVAITLSILIGVTLFLYSMMYFAFTKNLADFFNYLGCENYAGDLYYKAYEKNDEIFYCYKALNIKIKYNEDKKVVKFYKEFASDNQYQDFMLYLNESNDNLDLDPLEKSIVVGEDNYLKRSFVEALISTNRLEEAFEYSLKSFKDYENFTMMSPGVYTFDYFIDKNINFSLKYEDYDCSLVDAIRCYFDNIYGDFALLDVDNIDNLSKAYAINVGNRLILVGENLKAIYSSQDISDYIYEIEEKQNKINDIIKGFL